MILSVCLFVCPYDDSRIGERFNRYSDVRNGWSDSNDAESAGPPITFTLLSPLAATHTGDQRQDGYFEQRRH